MSVDPVHNNSTGIERTTPEPKQHSTPAPRTPPPVDDSAENSAKVEISKPKNIPVPLAIPVHEVKVILDTPDNNTLVYQVLNKQSGEVILQVPSEDHLRGIHDSQELLQRIAARGKDPASAEEPLPGVKNRRE
ncbi:MAG: hypothetical protein HY010_22510 [Acidobacteria bacterium]|nr:hypothetical protein [Acidobacteriota bacterium]